VLRYTDAMVAEESGGTDITRLLSAWKNGDQFALDLLTPLIYEELRVLARAYLARERHAETLQPTVLVHEAYLRLVAQQLPDFASRSHFYGVAAHLMRQILADHARKRNSQKRGAGVVRVPIHHALTQAPPKSAEIVALDDALTALASFDPRMCQVIELRFFGGLSLEETAQALDVSTATVGREQRLAEAWLYQELDKTSA